jgi:lipopolysaccharide export system permease protein
MWILDRQRYWAFLKAYIICFVALVGLYVVIDAFTNLDEFFKVEEKTLDLLAFMGRYYLVRLSLFYDRLCGVISMMAAIFTVTWMQRSNEHIAMMAAGISTQRAIRPVLISAVLFGLGAVANQELIIPRVAEELQRTPDDDGERKVRTFSRRDINEILIHSQFADRADRAIWPFNAAFPTNRYGVMLHLAADRALHIPDDRPGSPLAGGWLVRGASVSPADAPIDGSVLIRVDPPPMADAITAGVAGLGADAVFSALPLPAAARRGPFQDTYFLRTNLDFEALTQSRQWYQFADSADLLHALSDRTYEAERHEIAVFFHTRNLRPLLSLALLGLSLPMVLGGFARNTFLNLGFAMGTSAVFYSVLFLCQWLGNNRAFAPELAAWIPLLAFGTIAAGRWDRIRT